MVFIFILVEDYYSPHDITFSRDQVYWLLSWLELLREGRWPPNFTGYSQAPLTQHSRNLHAPFEIPVQYASEIDSRLERTGVDGKLLLAEIQLGKTIVELQPESRRALNYCSGYRRRRMDYRTWCRQRRYLHKTMTFPSLS